MNNFQKEFMMNMFLDNDSVNSMNRLAIAISDVISENRESINMLNDTCKTEYEYMSMHSNNAYECSLAAPVHRRRAFYEKTVRNYTNEDYLDLFKIKRSTVQAFINFLKEHLTPGSIPLEKKVHVFLWLLMSDCSYNDVSHLFGLHKSTVGHIFHEIASYLVENKHLFVSWPSIEEQHVSRIKVNSRFKFPNCVGFIDTCRFELASRQNRKDKPDVIVLQAVCDESLVFIDVHVADVGKRKKSKVFKDSPLAHGLKNFVEFENHLLGDSEYKLKTNLITPFTSEELLTPEEMKFNEVHWKTRSYIGHAFELLKERFRKLNHIDTVKPEFVHLLIVVSCILHNFILMHEGYSEIKEEPITCEDGVSINTSIVQNADEKRQFLCNYINYLEMDSN